MRACGVGVAAMIGKRVRAGVCAGAVGCVLALASASGAAIGADTATASVTSSAPAGAAKDPAMPLLGGFLRETRVVYPLRLGKWQAVDEHRFDRQEFGVSVRYALSNRSDRWIDVYFYPAGLLSPAEFEQVAREERDALAQVGKQPGGYESMEMGELRDFAYARRNGAALSGRSLDLGFTSQGERKSSAMTLQLDRMYLIKGRYSIAAKAASRDQARNSLEEFMADLSGRLTVASTGRCWNPLPIEKLEAGAPRPSGAVSSISKDGRDSAYLMGDRVLAREPQSDEAQALMMIGMGLGKRLHPGCAPPENIEQAVPKDMREIRLEYGAPSDAPADPSRLLRSNRIDVG